MNLKRSLILAGGLMLASAAAIAVADEPWSTFINSATDRVTLQATDKFGIAIGAAQGRYATPVEIQSYLQTNLLPAPGPIGGVTPAAGSFTTLSASGAATLSAAVTLPGLSAGTQVSCLGLDSGNHIVLNAASCGTGAGAVSITALDGSVTVAPSPLTGTGTITIGLAPVTKGGTGLTVGTSGGIPFFNSTTTMASSAALTANLPVIGGGAGAAPTVGSRSGNTTKYVTTTGALTNTHCAAWDANANLIDNGTTCGGSGTLTITDGTNSVSSTTLETLGNGFVVAGSAGSATVNLTMVDATKTSNYSAAAADMGYALNLGGTTATLTLPAASGSIFAPGMTLAILVSSSGNWTLTNSTGLTLNGLNSTTLVPGTSGTFVANADGTHLDFFPGPQPPTTTVLGGVLAVDCSSGGQFAQKINTDGTVTCATPSGSGTVTVVGAGSLTSTALVTGGGTTTVQTPAGATFAAGTLTIGTANTTLGSLVLEGSTSGAATIRPQAVASTPTLTLGTSSGTPAVTASSPLVITTATGNIACATCVTSAASLTSGAIMIGGGSQASSTDASATLTLGALGLGASGTAGSIALGNATSGTITLQPVTGALGSVTASLPANTGTIAELNLAQSWTAVQTFTNSDIKLLGSSTGATTFTSLNAGASNFTLSFPAATDTLVGLATSDTLTNKTMSGASNTFSAIPNTSVNATPLNTGTSVSLTAPRQYFVCTGTCTVTPPVPAAGDEFCVMNDDNVATVITLAALGSSARYENTARTAYGTAGTGTFVSGGAVGDKACIVGRDSTHYLTVSFTGTWTAS